MCTGLQLVKTVECGDAPLSRAATVLVSIHAEVGEMGHPLGSGFSSLILPCISNAAAWKRHQ